MHLHACRADPGKTDPFNQFFSFAVLTTKGSLLKHRPGLRFAPFSPPPLCTDTRRLRRAAKNTVYKYRTLYFPMLRTLQENIASRPIAAVWLPTGVTNTGPATAAVESAEITTGTKMNSSKSRNRMQPALRRAPLPPAPPLQAREFLVYTACGITKRHTMTHA